ncbi:MAG: HAMP domain-containing protein [Oscillospiraceae bacterium]|nr:HAMP domain-containing protein [Oscillospiraceae bacterium]
MKSIGKKIAYCGVTLVVVSLLIFGIISCVMAYKTSEDLAQSNMEEMVETAASRTLWELEAYSNIAQSLGTFQRLSNPDVAVEDKMVILNTHTVQFDLQRCNLIDFAGNGIDGNTYNEREYFQAAMKGETLISEPLVSKVTGVLTTIVAAPLWKDGEVNSEPVGCVYVVPDDEFLNDIVRDISISKGSGAYMIDKNGNTIAAVDTETVKNGENIEAIAKNNSSYAGIAGVHAEMRNGKTGFWKGKYNGEKVFMAYHPIEGTNGWSLVVYAPESDFMDGARKSIYFTIIIVVVAAAIATAAAVKLGLSIGNPIRICAERIEALADGDLTSPVPSTKSKDEVGILMKATGTVVGKLNGMIGDIGRILEAMSGGDLGVNTAEGKELYPGDFEKLRSYAKNINVKLSDAMREINDTADQVSSSSEQVSGGAQTLSQGATEQAASIEDLVSSIHTISDQVKQTSANCTEARMVVNETAEYVDKANHEMSNLTDSMNEINDRSAKISNIIKTIDNIAFRTNRLALNAAVEAAKAGEAGKGFAVVAEEVRSLASQSADAARDTADLIEQSIEAVRNGSEITSETASAMQSVSERTASVEAIVNKIASASEQQSDMIVQISEKVEQISKVVLSNSSAAEESAASAEELSSQATLLKSLIGAFKLRK